jgi:hypothetical protein
MVSTKKSGGRIAFVAAVLALALALVPVAFAGKPSGGSGGGSGSGCSISPSQVVLDQVWTVSASGLPPKSTVELIITFPDGAQSTGPISVSSGGTFTTTGNSNMSAGWGLIAPEQLGTYRYQFVNQVKWPAGTFTKQYATCSVQVG